MSDRIKGRPEPDSPDRCQAMTPKGQCALQAVPNSKYCIIHGGQNVANSEAKQALKNYRLGVWRARVADFTESEDVKSVREEIGILRLMMEERLNSCNSVPELLLQSHALCDLATRIERTVLTCHKLEAQMGQLMDKQAILRFAAKVSDSLTALFTKLTEDGTVTTELANLLIDHIADDLIRNASAGA